MKLKLWQLSLVGILKLSVNTCQNPEALRVTCDIHCNEEEYTVVQWGGCFVYMVFLMLLGAIKVILPAITN